MKYLYRINRIIQSYHLYLLTAVVVIALVWFTFVALARHMSFGSYHFDMGTMHQATYTSSRGAWLLMTDPYSFEQVRRFAYHFDPILILIAPLYRLYAGAEVLIIVQSLIVISGAIPVYLIAKRVLNNSLLSVLCALGYLMYYPMHFTLLADFHAVTLSTGLILWMMYFIDVRRYAPATLCALLIFMTKENAAMVVALYGGYIFLRRGNRLFGGLLGLAGLLTTVIVIGFVIPFFRSEDTHFARHYFDFSVERIMTQIMSWSTIQYLLRLLEPFGFLSLLSPGLLFLPISEYAINILAKNSNLRVLNYHYTAMLTPFIAVSAIHGLRTLRTYINRYISSPKARKHIYALLSIWIFASLFLTTSRNSPMHVDRYTINTAQRDVVRRWQRTLQDDTIPVAASGHLAPHFAGRTHFYNFFFDFAYKAHGYTDDEIRAKATHYKNAEYVLIKTSEVHSHPMVLYYYATLIADTEYKRIFAEEGIEVYRKQ